MLNRTLIPNQLVLIPPSTLIACAFRRKEAELLRDFLIEALKNE
jgi:hypothetical protein